MSVVLMVSNILGFLAWVEHAAIVHYVWFSDKANIIMNKQYTHLWAIENLHIFTENVYYSAKITEWATISNHGLIKALSFDKAVNSDSTCAQYVSFMPQFAAVGLLKNTMQNGATGHTVNIMKPLAPNVISGRYPNHHICGRIWPPNRLHINSSNISLWRFIKKTVSKYARLSDEVQSYGSLC
jgi:hypothetical protein